MAVVHLRSSQVCQSTNLLHYTPSGRIQSLGSAVSFPIFTQPFSCISYWGILRARLVIRVVSQQITKISCCYADLDPCWNVGSHRKTHCVYRKVRSSDQHPSSHVCDLAKWLQLISADRPIFGSTIIRVRCNFAPRVPLPQMSSLLRGWAHDWRHEAAIVVSVPEDRGVCCRRDAADIKKEEKKAFHSVFHCNFHGSVFLSVIISACCYYWFSCRILI